MNEDNKVNSDNLVVDEIQQLKKEIESLKMTNLQLIADFQNYRNRIENEKEIFGTLATLDLSKEILEIYDDLNFAINDDNLDFENSLSSLKTAQEKIINSLKNTGIEMVEVKVGDLFDKEKMEAISTVANEELKGKVVTVLSSAFKFRSRDSLIRHAKVIIGK